jgi:hypothetical protein
VSRATPQAISSASDLLAAIQVHASNGSEANGVIGNFDALPATTQ